jgi:hypothetical protein
VVFFRRYSINAILDVPLSKQLAAGRLFVGQKLRVMCWPLFVYLSFNNYNTDNIEFPFHIPFADLGSRIMWLEWASFTP